jgi:hypothetical protein
MAISRMQQPRQNYGLGSFVKKYTRKITKPFTKLARKLVPKEIAGIMRTAAPFLPPGYREAAYLLGTAKQTGRISPVDLALAAAPTFFSKTDMGRGIAQRVGDFKLPGMEKDLRTLAVGGKQDARIGRLDADPQLGPLVGSDVKSAMSAQISPPMDTQGIFGKGGDFNVLKGSLLSKPDGGIKLGTTAAIGAGVLSLIASAETPQEAGQKLVEQTGNSDDYERGVNLFAQLKPELFAVPEQFRMPVKDGGLMRTNFSMGSEDVSDRAQKYLDYVKEMEEMGVEPMSVEDFNKLLDSIKDNMAAGGLMRTNYAIGSEDPKPVNPFGPKPTGPVLPEEDKPFRPRPLKPIKMAGMDRKMAAQMLADELAEEEYGMDFYDLDIRTQMRIYQIALDMIDEGGGNAMGGLPNNRMNFAMGSDNDPKPIKPLDDMKMAGSDRYFLLLEEVIREMEEELGRELTNREYDRAGKIAYDRLSEGEYAKGGRVDYALGTRPTAQESGLGGLPIEADMRYTGGFMPYGAKEKADDVPARLSKNEFVFTADAVRAAGGGSVQKGAQKMYNTMKQLEAKPEAKGMMA